MTLHVRLAHKSKAWGWVLVIWEENGAILNTIIVFGLYLIYGNRYTDSKKIIEFIKEVK